MDERENIAQEPSGQNPATPQPPLDLKKTGLPPLLLAGLAIFGFVVAAALFAHFSRSAVRPAPASQPKAPAAPVTVMEVVPVSEPQPAVEGAQTEELPLPALTLSGILFAPEGSLALINGRIVREGAVVEGAKLEKVSSDRVEFSFGAQKIILRAK